ncbi:MAG TPA: hypothetical protein VGQ28_00120 [Thermoanaerobaculia bacterium]|jgi:hypothetical protein|nr:hypothetical protein [Thermoanaerobaculia bacterium]
MAASTLSRTALQLAVGAVTVAVAIFSRIELVVPFLLAWAIWWLMQRSKRPDRRWISAAFAVPAAFLLWKIVGGLLWKLHSYGLPEIALLGGILLWLFLRPGKLPLVFQIALHAIVVCLFLVFVVQHPNWGNEGLRGFVADLYFFVGTLGASLLALLRGPEVAANPQAVE